MDSRDKFNSHLGGGFSPTKKWIISPNRGEHKKSLKPPPRHALASPRACHVHDRKVSVHVHRSPSGQLASLATCQ